VTVTVARYANVLDQRTGRIMVMRLPKWWWEKTMLADALFGWLCCLEEL